VLGVVGGSPTNALLRLRATSAAALFRFASASSTRRELSGGAIKTPLRAGPAARKSGADSFAGACVARPPSTRAGGPFGEGPPLFGSKRIKPGHERKPSRPPAHDTRRHIKSIGPLATKRQEGGVGALPSSM
jgi:hypothetical protein